MNGAPAGPADGTDRTPVPLPISRDLAAAALALNNEHARELSWLDAGGWERLLGSAFYARRVGDLDGFLLALDQTADYESPKFRWFRGCGRARPRRISPIWQRIAIGF
jgi:hypothetical protein